MASKNKEVKEEVVEEVVDTVEEEVSIKGETKVSYRSFKGNAGVRTFPEGMEKEAKEFADKFGGTIVK